MPAPVPRDTAGGATAPKPDLIEQAVTAQLKSHQTDAQSRSWLGSAVHTLTDGITHAFGTDSNDSAAALKRLQDEYIQARQSGRDTEKLKNQIYDQIAKDRSALEREDTNAGYGTEFLKAAALFAPGKFARPAAGAVFALDETNNLTSMEGVAKLGLGFGKGYGLSMIYGKLGELKLSAPMQGVALGLSSRGLDTALSLSTYRDKEGNFSFKSATDNFSALANPQTLVTDAAIFTLAHGMFRAGNSFSGNALSRSPLANKMFMAGSFGMVSDAAGEAQKQIAQDGRITNFGSIFEHGVVGGIVNAAGGGITGARAPVDLRRAGQRVPERQQVVAPEQQMVAPEQRVVVPEQRVVVPEPQLPRVENPKIPGEPGKAAIENPDQLLAWRTEVVPAPEAIAQSNEYAQQHKVWDRLLPGFQNAGRGAVFDENGLHQKNRPATVFDPANDHVLRETFEEAHRRFDHLKNDPQALARALTEFANEKLRGTNGPQTDATEAALDLWYEQFNAQHVGQRVLLGEFIRQGKGVCSQQAFLTKVLADEFGLKAAFVRGLGGRHAWTTFEINGQEKIYDPRWQEFALEHNDWRIHRTLLNPIRPPANGG